jgi:molecular chaperone GrpE
MLKMPKKKKEETLDDEILENDTSAEGALEEVDQPIEEDEVIQAEEEIVDVEEALNNNEIPLDEKLELIKAAWEASEAKASEYLDGWQRAKAEFINYKKRVNRDRDQYNKDAIGKVVRNYLPVLDDLERALKDKPNDDQASWAVGIELVYRKLATILENDGVTRIEADGAMFDPNLHEAVAQLDSPDHESGQIVDVIQTGYMIGERVLRPARVCIAT